MKQYSEEYKTSEEHFMEDYLQILFPCHFDRIYSRLLFFNLLFTIAVTVISLLVMASYLVGRFNSQLNRYNMQLARQTQNYIDDTLIKKVLELPSTYFSELDSNYELTYPYSHDISNDSVMLQEIGTRLRNITITYNGFLCRHGFCIVQENLQTQKIMHKQLGGRAFLL